MAWAVQTKSQDFPKSLCSAFEWREPQRCPLGRRKLRPKPSNLGRQEASTLKQRVHIGACDNRDLILDSCCLSSRQVSELLSLSFPSLFFSMVPTRHASRHKTIFQYHVGDVKKLQLVSLLPMEGRGERQ